MSENLNVCLSGGASGADYAWGLAAQNANHNVIHWSFQGHRTSDPSSTIVLSKAKLEIANSFLERANQNLKRKWPTSNQFVNNLLRRNYYQIQDVDAVYAVSNLEESKTMLNISGGTAWACQMYVDHWLYDRDDFDQCKLFLFDQRSCKWLSWKWGWEEIKFPPTPLGVYAAIGTRELNDAGLNAICRAYG